MLADQGGSQRAPLQSDRKCIRRIRIATRQADAEWLESTATVGNGDTVQERQCVYMYMHIDSASLVMDL